MWIETDRLILREMTGDDFQSLYGVLSDPEVGKYYAYPFDEARVRGWINRNMERYRVLGFGLWAVILKETGELIGDCGLTMQLIHGQIKPEIGYHIRRDCQGKGYASEAAKAVRDWAFTNTPFNLLHSYMKAANEPSARTAIAYGCHLVDEYVDDAKESIKVYAISRSQWEALKNQ